MNTITQITKKVLSFVEQELKNQIMRSLEVNPFSLSINESIDFNYFLEKLMYASNHTYISIFKLLLESFDLAYFNSPERKNYYYSKGRFSRTLLTKYGEITFKRYSYQLKSGGKHFYYLDTKFGIDKYCRLDHSLKNYLYYLVGQETSYATVGKQLGRLIYRDKCIDDTIKSISRATVFNDVKRHNIQSHCYSNQKIKVTQLFIEVDEHYVSIQEKHQTNKKMIKCAKIYSQLNQSRYENRIILFENHQSFWSRIINTIESHFDVTTIQHIYILGDGASWIKSGVQMFERGKAKYIIDRFHYFQALHHIFTKQHKDLYQIAKTYIINNQRKDFKLLINTFEKTNPSRTNTISYKKQYLLKNWAAFQKSIQYQTSCRGKKFNHLLTKNKKEEAYEYTSLWKHFDKITKKSTYSINLPHNI